MYKTVAEFKLRFVAEQDEQTNLNVLAQLQAECSACGTVLASDNFSDLSIQMLIHLSDKCTRTNALPRPSNRQGTEAKFHEKTKTT